MTPIPGLPEHWASLPSVQMTPPPLQWKPDAERLITEALASLGEERGAIVWIATQTGVNLAIVQKVNTHVEILGYAAKSWGKPLAAGVVGRIHW